MVDGLLAVEPDADAGTGHDDAEAVPFAGWLVGQHEWVFARLARGVVPKGARAELGVMLEGLLVGRVPDLDLRHAAEVDARVAFRGHVVFEHQFEVAVVFVGRRVGAGAGVEDFAILHGPVLREFVTHFLQHRVLLFASKFGDRVRIIAVPASKVLAVEERGEARRCFGEESGSRDGEEGGEETHRSRKGGEEGLRAGGLRGVRGCSA